MEETDGSFKLKLELVYVCGFIVARVARAKYILCPLVLHRPFEMSECVEGFPVNPRILEFVSHSLPLALKGFS